MNKLWLMLLIVGGLAACATSPPRSNPWADKAIAVEPAARPVELPSWPTIETCGVNLLCLSPKAADTLLTHAEVADANYTIALELAAAVDELTVAHNALVKAGAAEHELAELRGVMVADERRGRLWDKLSYWALLVLVGVAAAK